MARVLIVGCGARGLALARRLRGDGHAVRGTTRHPARTAELAAAGVEPVIADPDRIATLVPAFDGATIAILMLGSATGSREALAALHETRLEMLLTKLVDTTVRGLVYEGAGTVPEELLSAGARLVRNHCALNRIPAVVTDAPISCDAGSLERARETVDALLAGEAIAAPDRLVR